MKLDLHQLRIFVAVSRAGNVARAADALALTASPVSRSLRELERQTGPLFERAYHDMRPLPRGRDLLPIAVDTLQLASDFADRAAGLEPVLRTAATPWSPSRVLDAYTQAIAGCGLAVDDREGAASSGLIERLRHGEIDLALIHMPIDLPGIASRALGAYRFELIVPTGDPIAARAESAGGVGIDAIAGRRVLMFPVAMQPMPSGELWHWLAEAGASQLEEVDLTALHTLATRLRRAGAISVGVVGDDLPLQFRDDRVVRVPITGDQPAFQLGLAWRETNPSRMAAIRAIESRLRDELYAQDGPGSLIVTGQRGGGAPHRT